MGFFEGLNNTIKKGLRSWLQINPANPIGIQINEIMDFELSAIRNRIWYRGDGNEIEQLYQQCREHTDRFKFWACRPTAGLEIRKIHTGLPGLIVDTLTSIVLSDLVGYDFGEYADANRILWDDMVKDNEFSNVLKSALTDTLVVGDGAFKIIVDTTESQYPLIEWVPGERVEIVKRHGRVKEVIFKTAYPKGYTLYEYYSRGKIRNELYKGDKQVDILTSEWADEIKDYDFDEHTMLAIPFSIKANKKYRDRGGSLFDGKLDAFDAFDEAWSQWMDALRAGRSKTYIPEALIPRNPNTGEILKPNAFDNRYIKTDGDMAENAKNIITTEQPAIPHDSYLSTYITALDLCLQGIISPSTLGIDVKKLDNAEAQREKEKTTLYTRDSIVETLQQVLPKLITSCLNAYNMTYSQPVADVNVTVQFGEYANPSFESQIETLAKARTGSPLMSVEAQVEELYGDSKDKAWKDEEVKRLKEEMGIGQVEEPAVNTEFGENTRTPTMYEITSILGKRAKGTLTYNNAKAMLERIGVNGDEAETLLNDKDE